LRACSDFRPAYALDGGYTRRSNVDFRVAPFTLTSPTVTGGAFFETALPNCLLLGRVDERPLMARVRRHTAESGDTDGISLY
jgi:hypothetical protein